MAFDFERTWTVSLPTLIVKIICLDHAVSIKPTAILDKQGRSTRSGISIIHAEF